MLRSVLVTSTLGLVLGGPALAQPADAWNWTGPYVGVNAGYGGGDFKYPFSGTTDQAGTNPVAGQLRQNSSGGLAGGQIGYNYEMPSGWLMGLEADIDGANIQGRSDYFGQDSLGNGYSGSVRSRIDYLGTVRGRLGAAMFGGRFVPYVTGGFAYAGMRTDGAVSCSACNGGVASGSSFATDTRTRTGWTAGAGAEYALTNHLSFKAEYLYADFGHANLAGDGGQFSAPGVSVYNAAVGEKADANLVRVGLNYRF